MQWNIIHSQRNEVLIYATVWEKLENIMLKVRSQTQKATYIYMQCLEFCKFIDPESRLVIDSSSGGRGTREYFKVTKWDK